MASSPEPVESWERRPGAVCLPIAGYRRREPERTLLHGVVRDRLGPFLAARDPGVASRLLGLFTRAVFAWQRRSAGRLGVAEPRTAGVTAVQRFGSAINLNVHFHTLVPDGVFDLSDPGPARFVPLRAPTDEEVAKILTATIRKVARAGLLDAEGSDDDEPFAALQAVEVDRRLRLPDPFQHPRRSSYVDGFSLHAGVRIHENDREGLARPCRYAVRPPFALHRLSAGPEGRLAYRMKRPRGGSFLLLPTPNELLARIATLVPPPRSHALRYHGLFAPNARHRKRVVPARPGAEPPPVQSAETGRLPAQPPPGCLAPVEAPPERPLPRTRNPGPSSCGGCSRWTCSTVRAAMRGSSSSPTSPRPGWRGGSWTTSGWRHRLRHSLVRDRTTQGKADRAGPDSGESDPVYEE